LRDIITNAVPAAQPWLQPQPGFFGLSWVWIGFIAIAMFLGLIGLVRGTARVGRMALWKGFLVGLLALAITVVIVGGVGYVGADVARPYMDMLGFGQQITPAAPGTTPGTVVPTTAPAPVPTPDVTPVPTPGG
jgi:hypothetical protein